MCFKNGVSTPYLNYLNMFCCFNKPQTLPQPMPTTMATADETKHDHFPTWQELLGSKDWENLLDPFDLSLRNLILRCGDFCQATYDAFNNDQNSKYCGSSRYGKKTLFDKVMLEKGEDYEIVSFLYATAQVSVPEAFLLHSQSRESWDKESNWIGYVAVTTDKVSEALGRREIYVAWRGTCRNYEWINVLGAKLTSVNALLSGNSLKKVSPTNKAVDDGTSSSDEDEEEPKVMQGWMTIYTSSNTNSTFAKTSARTQLVVIIKSLMEKHKGENLSITLTGHSLGASLSVLSAFDLVQNVTTSNIPIAAFIFGCPQVGNEAFKTRLNEFPNVKILHIRNTIDLIPRYPSRVLGYVYIGKELLIDSRKSTSLKDSKNPSDWHNLQALLHVVAGWNGDEGEFKLRVKRSLAMVNKSSACLKDEYLVPESWWVEKNKGMVRGEDGEWRLASPDDDDQPVPEF